MFTGIVKGIGKVAQVKTAPGLTSFAVAMDPPLLEGLQQGASVAIDGVCLTVVNFDAKQVWFDAIAETLNRTHFNTLKEGQLVNVERSARFGDEIGGHILSGHIFGTVTVTAIERTPNNCAVTFQCPIDWTKYLFPKGYIALNGASLTVVDVNKTEGQFSVHLIPETLLRSTFGKIKVGDRINLEFDSQTQTLVDSIKDSIESYANRSTN